ncbi:hypothetical protein COT94_00255 [Candidatus Falkowbacteria bacterium CG10_big_fil_rev_8_21_14_0_10_37_14]|uniref:UPF0235 protein COT94_00255 n=1 Tax=Candidatus Falkowbacteria bacterium CG10_big_fil_rev_8_21_14_0_10_37_14 TaxID=1974561 RepID=A0A2M6WUC0_9BACT|nr:DUF167 domain-containing protein [Candidatus Falkowbacteria bacterium]PIT96380.1 MAG: hypothetical protein COT94_00255 [Candidatus Falkowbacteria bacterium CG10_big_fil_rev_8_21_14_0_10_37_14]
MLIKDIQLVEYIRKLEKNNLSLLSVSVHPNAKTNDIKILSTGLKINITATPADGEANKAVIKLLAKQTGIAKSHFCIIRGLTSRTKLIKVEL